MTDPTLGSWLIESLKNPTIRAWVLGVLLAGLLVLLPRRLYHCLHRWGWIVIFVTIALLGVAAAGRDIVDHDEVQHLHASWLITQGHKPYADFFEHHPPLYWHTAGRLVHALCPAPTIAIFRTSRLLATAIAVLAAAGLIWLARELDAGPTVALAALLLPLWMHPAFEFRPDGAAVLFSVAALAALARAVRRGSGGWAAVSGVGLAVAVGMVVKVWVVVGVWLLVVVWLIVARRSAGGWRVGLWAIAGAAAGGLAVLGDALWVADRGGLWRCVIEANLLRQQVLPSLPWKGYLVFLAVACPPFLVGAAVSIMWGPRGFKCGLPGLAVVSFGVSVVLVVAQQRLSVQYFLMPVMAAGVVLMVVEREIRRAGLSWWYGKVLLAAVLGLGLGRTWVYVEELGGERAERRAEFEAMMGTVLEHVSAGQKVIGSIPIHPIWATDSAGWFCPPVMRDAGAKAGWWPGDPAAFAERLMADGAEVVVAPVGGAGVGWNDEILVQRNFRAWLGGNYVCVGVGEFWERQYGVFVAGSER